MEKNINEIFKELFIMVGDTPVPLNVIGLLRVEYREYIVLNDMEGFVGPDEYVIIELIRDENGVSIEGIENSTLYDEICAKWENYLAERGVVIDS